MRAILVTFLALVADVLDPAKLHDRAQLEEYESRRTEETLRFSVNAR